MQIVFRPTIKCLPAVLIFLLFGLQSNAQHLFLDTENKKWLFAGGLQQDSIKVASGNELRWLLKTSLTPYGTLNTSYFLQQVFKNGLFFQAEGDEPFWRMTIYEKTAILTINAEKKYNIALQTNKADIDQSFCFTFHDPKMKVFGMIRSLGLFDKQQQACQLCLIDELTVYEAFITVGDTVYKGCATIRRK